MWLEDLFKNTTRRLGDAYNNSVSWLSEKAKPVLNTVNSIAGKVANVIDDYGMYSDMIPVVGQAIRYIGSGAKMVKNASNYANQGINTLEKAKKIGNDAYQKQNKRR